MYLSFFNDIFQQFMESQFKYATWKTVKLKIYCIKLYLCVGLMMHFFTVLKQ